mmetsp:Transcript_97836/g.272206  ORF Transcript_97836/g.272206 Transcript_97836/m.272206 type:complete len:430 (+) Transcript_97836:228-1517(+)
MAAQAHRPQRRERERLHRGAEQDAQAGAPADPQFHGRGGAVCRGRPGQGGRGGGGGRRLRRDPRLREEAGWADGPVPAVGQRGGLRRVAQEGELHAPRPPEAGGPEGAAEADAGEEFHVRQPGGQGHGHHHHGHGGGRHGRGSARHPGRRRRRLPLRRRDRQLGLRQDCGRRRTGRQDVRSGRRLRRARLAVQLPPGRFRGGEAALRVLAAGPRDLQPHRQGRRGEAPRALRRLPQERRAAVLPGVLRAVADRRRPRGGDFPAGGCRRAPGRAGRQVLHRRGGRVVRHEGLREGVGVPAGGVLRRARLAEEPAPGRQRRGGEQRGQGAVDDPAVLQQDAGAAAEPPRAARQRVQVRTDPSRTWFRRHVSTWIGFVLSKRALRPRRVLACPAPGAAAARACCEAHRRCEPGVGHAGRRFRASGRPPAAPL